MFQLMTNISLVILPDYNKYYLINQVAAEVFQFELIIIPASCSWQFRIARHI